MIIYSCSLYPFITESDRNDGLLISQPKKCRKCKDPECIHFGKHQTNEMAHYQCSTGFSVYVIRFEDCLIRLNGLLDRSLNASSSYRFLRKTYPCNRVTWDSIVAWVNFANGVVAAVNKRVRELVLNNISPLHDVKTALAVVLNTTQHIIGSGKGATFDDKLQNTSTELKTLFHAAALLSDQLNYLDVIANPDRITHGIPGRTEIYKLFHRVARILYPIARKNKTNIELEGQMYKTIDAYASLQLVPLILLDNAIKYSVGGVPIRVVFDDTPNRLAIEVVSYGPIVSKKYRDHIFDKHFRTPLATKYAQGGGVGLYIAQEICKAHGTLIQYYTGGNTVTLNKELCGENIFRVEFAPIPGRSFMQ